MLDKDRSNIKDGMNSFGMNEEQGGKWIAEGTDSKEDNE
jgi:hypothetical protein